MQRLRNQLDSSANLGTLSISSLAGTNTVIDDVSVDDDFDQADELYQRLHDLEQMTQTFLTERPIKLTDEHDSFTDVDKGGKQDFELHISEFLHEEVLCLSILCIPETVNEEALYGLDEAPKVIREHQPLDIILNRISSLNSVGAESSRGIASHSSSDLSFLPTLHNAEYSYALTSASGVIPGIYHLTVQNIGFATQPIRVTHSVMPSVRAIPIRAAQRLIGCNGPNEFTFYRYTCPQPSNQLITIRVTPGQDDSGCCIGDPDLYVTNRYGGQVEVSKDNYVWKSTNVGRDRVDIHPEDMDVVRGGTYIIGVLGYKERNEFEIEVTLSTPKPIRHLEVGESIDIQLTPEDQKYFKVQLDTSNKSRLFMTVVPILDSIFNMDGNTLHTAYQPGGRRSAGSSEREREKEKETVLDEETICSVVSQAYGRCVYTCDSLAAYGLVGKGAWREGKEHPHMGIPPLPGVIKAQAANTDEHSLLSTAIPASLPSSLSLSRGLFPVAHLSSSCMYPSEQDFSWRSSGADGNIVVMFENDEWSYTSGSCYFALSLIKTLPLSLSLSSTSSSCPVSREKEREREREKGLPPLAHLTPEKLSLPSSVATSPVTATTERERERERDVLTCRVTVWESSTLDRLSSDIRERYDIFQSVFRDIDGSNTSQKERSRVGREDQSLTYGEVEYLSFIDILKRTGACHGDVFYDLGCGAGKAVISAALSGIQFMRCVGLEILPGLCDCARSAISKVKGLHGGNIHNIPMMEIRESDILTADWSAADVLYISSICFSDNFMQSILEKCSDLKPGTTLITLKLPDNYENILELEHQHW
eukprot:CAMPEP_0182426556 /NCGR_PEP_ID=MMETSP1167-20130531/13041_1 /TAXON_ID=2988 /ORGANISM="Mallomonas Sp, Strain CCMP3275" /LENGTH=817 /DNA_ID=CAMNT_0024608059 /DNA_START=38 /DNA_END=2488 /DNA_ORIENTATION=+